MHRQRSVRSAVAVLIATALIVSMAGIVPAGAVPQERGTPPKAPTRVTSGSLDVTGSKLDARLAQLVSTAGRTGDVAETEVDVAVLAAKDAQAPADLIKPLKMVLRGDPDNDLWVAKAKVGKLLKIASAKDVVFVFENGRREPPKVPDSGGGGAEMTDAEVTAAVAKLQGRLESAREAGAPAAFRAQFDDAGVLADAVDPITYDGGSATGWFDISEDGHNSSGAWDQGYRGDGVRVAVADDSCDFGHPDLMGTHAVIDDPTSPYDGWPQAFDPYSLLLYAYESFYGVPYVSEGYTWFSDTSATITESDPEFDGATLITPGTSLSGTYHVGYLWDENYYYYGFGVFPFVLVADENEAGVYDTVYVDLDNDWDFSYDKPCTKDSPVSYADLWDYYYNWGPDGFADISGGMIYWIADGSNQPPGAEFMFGEGFPTTPGSGDMVCFMGALNVDEDHGTLCSSNVVGQGMSDAPSVWGDYPVFKTPEPLSGNGIVQGAAPEAELVAIADIYWNHFASTLAAYDYAAFGLDNEPYTGDDCQIVSNSYGESDEDADGWDYRSRYVTYLNTYWNDQVAYLFSTGNGAPGYGTTAPPGPATGISVGASTQMGACGGWDSIYDMDQVTVGDVIPWSNRGPSASGGLSPDIVADGAYSSGAVPTNMYWYEGSSSWDIWGGTSRSCPVAAGNLALVFEAYHADTGSWPDYATAKQLIMNGARDLNYDTLVQGAGSVDAGRAVSLASGGGGIAASPSAWNPGDYLGDSYPSFANVVHPGDTVDGVIRLTNKGTVSASVDVSDAWYQPMQTTTMTIELDASELDSYDFSRPDYVTEITSLIPADADLMVIRTSQDITDFAPSGAFDTGSTTHNVTRPLVYDWKDQDSDGELWDDTSANGFVNGGEMDEGEFMRFTYHNNFANTHELRVQKPLDRMHDGVFLGLQWARRDPSDTVTSIDVEITFWQRADSGWLSAGSDSVALDGGESADVPVTLEVPADAPIGIYEASFRFDDGTNVTVVPVVINVASDTFAFEFGDSDAAPAALMDNGKVFGTQDWQWRAESGDWRFFWTDGSGEAELPAGASWLVHTMWEDRGAPEGMKTDLDTLLYGPAIDEFSTAFPETFGPYSLGLNGGSGNTNIGAGIWTFQTNTGTTEEWVAGPITQGLNQIMVHNVLYDGLGIGADFTGEAGMISVSPDRLDIVSREDAGAESVDFTTYTLPLTGAAAEAYGLTRKLEETADISTGNSVWYDIELTHAAYLDIQTACAGQDIDLYVYWFNGADWYLVGASETSSGEENVNISMPPDGPYMIEVYGYSVSGVQPFDITISSPMGDDMALSGIPAGGIGAGGGFTLDVDWTKVRSGALEDREGEFEGVIFLGPVEAPGAVQVPVTLRYPFEIEWSSPVADQSVTDRYATVDVTFSKRVDPASLDESTFYLMKGMDVVPGTIDYDDVSATAVFTPDDPLAHLATYEFVIDGVMSVDGDSLSTDIPFTTDFSSRASGADRYGTAVDTSRRTFDSAENVVLATGERFPDALSSAGLAGALGAPLLLTRSDELPDIVADEIERLGASNVVIVGGPEAVSSGVESAVDALAGVSVDRVYGDDRYETAAAIARAIADEVGPALPDICFLARGDTFPDALALSPFAYAQTVPILLTQPDAMPDVTSSVIDDLGFDEMLVAGETEAISLAAASGSAISNVHRAGGVDRYATAAEVAAYGASRGWGSWSFVGVATGEAFPDGLTGGAATGRHAGVLLLTPTASTHGATVEAITAEADAIDQLQFYGGSKAIAEAVVTAYAGLLP